MKLDFRSRTIGAVLLGRESEDIWNSCLHTSSYVSYFATWTRVTFQTSPSLYMLSLDVFFGPGFRRSLQKDWWLSHPLLNLPVSSCLFCIDEVSREKGPQYLGLFGMILLHCFVRDSPDALLTSFYQRISFLIGWDFVFFHGYHGSGWFRSTAERLWFLHFTLTVLKSSAGLAAIWNEVWNLNVCNLSPRVATDISIYFNIYISIYFTYVFHLFSDFQNFSQVLHMFMI